MRNWLHGLLLLGLSVTVGAMEMKMNQVDENRQLCAGMYSRDSWGGAVEPHILVKFIKNTEESGSDPITSLVIFEWKDYSLIGVLPTADSLTVFGVIFAGRG
jgi:hypothetical protein